MISSSKGCSPKRHPYTRASFLCQCLQADIGKRMLSSPPASPLPKYGRNRIRAGRRTKTQPKKVIRANVCLVRRPCQNHIIADTQTVNTYREPSPSKRYRPRLRLLTSSPSWKTRNIFVTLWVKPYIRLS